MPRHGEHPTVNASTYGTNQRAGMDRNGPLRSGTGTAQGTSLYSGMMSFDRGQTRMGDNFSQN